MSLFETSQRRMCLRSDDNKKRNSFSERFCDDLAECLLQYLPLEEKLRLECVSKQFQKTLFVKQYVIKSYVISRLLLIKSFAPNSYSVFRKVLDKCTNLRSFEYPHRGDNIDNNVLEYFRHISCGYELSNIFITDICRNCFAISTKLPDQQPISIRTVKCQSISQLFDLTKVQRLEQRLDFGPNDLTYIVQNFGENLKYLTVDLYNYGFSELNYTLDIISNLKNLVHLEIKSSFGLNDINLNDSWKKILVNNCITLKSIDIVWTYDRTDIAFEEIFSPLLKFKSLKKLRLLVITNDLYKKYADNTIHSKECFSFKLFKGFSNITHLNLILPVVAYSESVFIDIHMYLPKLQCLEFFNRFSATTRIVAILGRLTTIQTLVLEILINCEIFSETEGLIKKNLPKLCRKLDNIELIDLYCKNKTNNNICGHQINIS